MKGRGAILQKTNQDMHSWCLEIYSPGIEIYPEIYPYSLFPWIRRGNWYHSHVCMLQLWSCILFVWSVKQTKKKSLNRHVEDLREVMSLGVFSYAKLIHIHCTNMRVVLIFFIEPLDNKESPRPVPWEGREKEKTWGVPRWHCCVL